MSVVNAAKADGEITPDEYNILKQLSMDAAEYAIALEDAQSDGIIDSEEQKMLDGLKERLLSNAERVAEEDGVLTQDEVRLLIKIGKALKS